MRTDVNSRPTPFPLLRLLQMRSIQSCRRKDDFTNRTPPLYCRSSAIIPQRQQPRCFASYRLRSNLFLLFHSSLYHGFNSDGHTCTAANTATHAHNHIALTHAIHLPGPAPSAIKQDTTNHTSATTKISSII